MSIFSLQQSAVFQSIIPVSIANIDRVKIVVSRTETEVLTLPWNKTKTIHNQGIDTGPIGLSARKAV
jgi:hypothetical protein